MNLGLDSGGGFFKVCFTVHSADEDADDAKLNSPSKKKSAVGKKYKNSGVKKVIVLLIVEQVPEKRENIEKLFRLLNIGSIDHSVVCDCKMQNLILGINAHGGTHCCGYCEVCNVIAMAFI